MLRVSGVLFLLNICIFLGGCSMHGAWRDTKDMFVGTKFDPDKNLNVQAKSYYRRFVPAGGGYIIEWISSHPTFVTTSNGANRAAIRYWFRQIALSFPGDMRM